MWRRYALPISYFLLTRDTRIPNSGLSDPCLCTVLESRDADGLGVLYSVLVYIEYVTREAPRIALGLTVHNCKHGMSGERWAG